MKLKCIGCEVLARPIYHSAALSPHVVDVELLPRGLHNQPADLRARLQAIVDASGELGYDAILLAYGLCGQATSGLIAPTVPVVIPRAHDCITLFLGSRQRYNEQFEGFPGTYWYTQDYVERYAGSGASLSLGSGTQAELQGVYEEYVSKYGQDNADYLMEVMGAWQKHYRRAVYIELGLGDGSATEAQAKDEAARRGWAFERLAGDLVLIRRLLIGDWQEDYLVLPPGHRVVMSYDEAVIACKSPSQTDLVQNMDTINHAYQ
ncbi:MAG TPA: DUF1638 domain-containing protein [Anaerolineales bacterium]|nr:DUF1638 domain-containing protein [Anaerolineales bacterium]